MYDQSLRRLFFIMVDKEKVEQAIRLLLEGIGEDTEREGLKDTPDRIARMCMEIYGGLDEEADHHLAKQFQVENNEMVLEKDITFYSMCEHHLMPFYGKAAIAYIPNGKVTGLSKLARTVDVYARRPQIQERLTVQIADALERTLNPKGIMVMLEAEHTCMTMRGIKKPGSKTITTVTRGAFKDNMELRSSFFPWSKTDASGNEACKRYLEPSPLSEKLERAPEAGKEQDFLQAHTGAFF